MANSNLSKAKKNKNDEWYTQLKDIENELKNYENQFKNKIVFCNCDDPYESNFFQYFAMNFNRLGLKKLITTSYLGSEIAGKKIPLEELGNGRVGLSGAKTYKVEILEVKDKNNSRNTDIIDVELLLKNDSNVVTPLVGDGDFRSDECKLLLNQSDIIVTNPPFSLFKEFLNTMIDSNVKFLVLGDQNHVTHLDIFKNVMNGKLWFGYDNGGKKWFRVPDHYDIPTESAKKVTNGIKYFAMGRILWFTNLDTSKREETLTLYKKYTKKDYPTYKNYPAIEVSKVSEIPVDYMGEMGVPITFLSKYNPKQFEIIGNSEILAKPMSDYVKDTTKYTGNGKKRFYIHVGNGNYKRLYDRIVIKRKNQE